MLYGMDTKITLELFGEVNIYLGVGIQIIFALMLGGFVGFDREVKLKAARELSDELENLSLEERERLKKSLDDIVRDTPQTTVAATRFKKLVAKAGPVVADSFRKILVDVLSETAKKVIWPS